MLMSALGRAYQSKVPRQNIRYNYIIHSNLRSPVCLQRAVLPIDSEVSKYLCCSNLHPTGSTDAVKAASLPFINKIVKPWSLLFLVTPVEAL